VQHLLQAGLPLAPDEQKVLDLSSYIPWPRLVVLLTGVLELLGVAGVLYRPTRRAAGVGLFALTITVTPANLYMLQHANLFHVPRWVLVARLPLQGGAARAHRVVHNAARRTPAYQLGRVQWGRLAGASLACEASSAETALTVRSKVVSRGGGTPRTHANATICSITRCT
jgi:uncharacterized membrane protein